MNLPPIVTVSPTLDTHFRNALARASTQDSEALQEATDAYINDVVQQLRAFAKAQGGACAAALSHALVKTPAAAYARHDFTQNLPTELSWRILQNLSLDDLAAFAQVNRRGYAWTRDILSEEQLLASRWQRLSAAGIHVRFNDTMREGRHWGDTLRANPVHAGWYLLSQENGVEVSQMEGDALVSRRLWPAQRHSVYRGYPPSAWHPSGDAYVFVSHETGQPVLYRCEREGDALTSTPLGFANICAVAFSPANPAHLLLTTATSTVVVHESDPTRVLCDLPGGAPRQPLSELCSPVRPWILRTHEDGRIRRIMVVHCGGSEARVLHTLEQRWGSSGNAAWHPTRPIFAVVTDDDKFCVVNLEGETPRVDEVSIFNVVKFRNSSMYGHVYLAWDPAGAAVIAASCSDELIITHVQNNKPARIAVAHIADVNGRGLNWSVDGHVEVIFGDGDIRRFKPVRLQGTIGGPTQRSRPC